MKKIFLTFVLATIAMCSFAQRVTDKLDRGLIAMKVTGGVYISWRINGEEYYDVTYNVYRDGVKLNDTPLNVSNYTDKSGTTGSTYTVSAVVRGKEQEQCKSVSVWSSSYKEIKLKHEDIQSTLIPNDACCADVDGDGELEILMKFDNLSEMNASYPRDGYKGEYSIFEVFKMDGKRLWWVNCGPNMGDFQNNEQNIIAYDWDGDGKAEAVMRAADGTVIHMANGKTYTVGNASFNCRAATGGGTNWFVHGTDANQYEHEWLVYMNGETGEPYQCIRYPLRRLEQGETTLNEAWGDGYGHRASKYFFGAPYLDGRKPSIFLARGIYTRHKMIAYDVDPATHTLVERWRWYNNANGPWKWQGYHNYGIADVDWDGRDEIVFGSMVIDDNGKGLSTTALGHGDAQHCGDFNPYIHGQEIYACLEDNAGNNYRDATTSKIYHRFISGNDDGRAMAGNFTDDFPGGLGCSAREGAISTVTNEAIDGLVATGVNTNFRIYWDGDLCSETFNYLNGKNTEGCIAKYGSWTPIYICEGSMTNNDTKGTPCYQGDLFGDWREEIIMRTADNNIRIYSTPTPTEYRIPTLWSDHQYRNAMVWQMCGYNQPPHTSYFIGKLEGITEAPPPLTMTDREEVSNNGTIGASLNDKHVIVCETNNTNIKIENGAQPYILTFNVPTWVQGSAGSESTNQNAKIIYDTDTCTVTGGGITGAARLVKQGDGVLNLPKADFTHTGETNIWAGVLNFDGTMKNSPLWLNRFAELNSNGGEFKSIKADYASIIRPGGENAKGTITTGDLALGFGSRIVFDLYSEGYQSDLIKAKNISIERKTGNAWVKGGPKYLRPVIELTGHLNDGEEYIAPGEYVICEYSGEIEGSVDDIILEGLAASKKSLKAENGKLIVVIEGMRDATAILWSGAAGNVWDFAETENFSIYDDASAEPVTFVVGDKVIFDDTADTRTVSVKGNLMPSSFTVDNTQAYVFNGEGSIDGTASFTKEGTGAVTMNGKNSYTGGNYLKGGITKVSLLANEYSEVGNLGGVITNNQKFTMENGAELQTSVAVINGSPIRFIGSEGGVINNSADFTQSASFYGTTLTKKGSGWLKTGATGANLDRMIIAAGTVQNNSGNAAKTVEFQGGSLVDGPGTNNAIFIDKGKKGTWTTTNRVNYSNKITGEGELTVYCAGEQGSGWVATRTQLQLDLSSFAGTIVPHSTIAADGRFTLNTNKGSQNMTFNIPAGVTVQNRGVTLRIGQVIGSGTLGGWSSFANNESAGTNTWQVGNGEDFTFAGKVTSGDSFTKMGSGTMTVSGVWDVTGAVRVNEGELNLKSGAVIGKGVLNVAEGATLSGVTKSGTPLTNSSYTINGTLQLGVNSSATSGNINFGGKSVTFGAKSRINVGLRKTALMTASGPTPQNTFFTNVNTLKITEGATIAATISELNQKTYLSTDEAVADTFYVWTDAKAVNITGDLNFELPELLFSDWDTSRISEGMLIIRFNKEKYNAYLVIIDAIDASETVAVSIYTLNGISVGEFTSTMGGVQSAFSKQPLSKGIYLLHIKSETGKQGTLKLMK
ncbi:MAG: autotransporter-associated beta strand repeat-containing protein [Prevotellaceae bacterium]|nr:autotransporter-associated beta strand repeat-containing protein [Prevotellaceae bacterium]